MKHPDTFGDLFKQIDRDLAPFLEALDCLKDHSRTPKDIIKPAARKMVVAIQSDFKRS